MTPDCFFTCQIYAIVPLEPIPPLVPKSHPSHPLKDIPASVLHTLFCAIISCSLLGLSHQDLYICLTENKPLSSMSPTSCHLTFISPLYSKTPPKNGLYMLSPISLLCPLLNPLHSAQLKWSCHHQSIPLIKVTITSTFYIQWSFSVLIYRLSSDIWQHFYMWFPGHWSSLDIFHLKAVLSQFPLLVLPALLPYLVICLFFFTIIPLQIPFSHDLK